MIGKTVQSVPCAISLLLYGVFRCWARECSPAYPPPQPLINSTAVETWLETVPPTCARLNSAYTLYDTMVRYYASDVVCPSVRRRRPDY